MSKKDVSRRAKRTKAERPSNPYRRTPNLDLLPEELRPRTLTSVGRKSLYGMAIALVLLVFLISRQQSFAADRDSLKAQLESINSRIATERQQKVQVDALIAEKDLLTHGSQDLQQLAGFTSWASFLGAARESASAAGVTLITIHQKSGGAVISGFSPSPDEAMMFRHSLDVADNVALAAITSVSISAGQSRFNFTVDVSFVAGGLR